MRNKIVHAIDLETQRSRMQLDLRAEAIERFESTDHDLLEHNDRMLFDTNIDDLMTKPYTFIYRHGVTQLTSQYALYPHQ